MDDKEQNFSFKQYFIPLTTLKAIHFIILIGLIVFLNMLFNDFVWDDKGFILSNPDISSFNFLHLLQTNSFNNGGQYRPIPAIYFASFYALFQGTTFFYHFCQLMIHIVNTIFLFFIFKNFLNKHISFFLSLIFLIHPMQVESVSYISASDNPLFFFFGILALLLSLSEKVNIKKLVFIHCFILFSLLTKETGILFLLLILLYRTLFKKPHVLSFFIGGITSIVFYVFIRIFIGGVFLSSMPLSPISMVSVSQRLLNIPQILFYYLKTFLYPAQLSMDQHWVIAAKNFSTFSFPLIIDSLFFLLLGIIGLYIFKKKKNIFSLYLFFCSWFCLGLLFHLQIFPLDMTVADRWFYFPMAGLLGIIGISMQAIRLTNRNFRYGIYLAGIVLLILLSTRTIVRNTNWVNQLTLFNHDAKISDNFFIETNLAWGYGEYASVPNYTEELKHFQKAAIFFPCETTYAHVASAYKDLNNIPKAKEYYRKALGSPNYIQQTHTHDGSTYLGYAQLLLAYDTPRHTEIIIEKALNDYPDSPDFLILLALIKVKKHDTQAALDAANKAYTVNASQQNAMILHNLKTNTPFKINLDNKTLYFN